MLRARDGLAEKGSACQKSSDYGAEDRKTHRMMGMVHKARPSLQRVVSSPGKRIQQLKQGIVGRKGIHMPKGFSPWGRGRTDLLDNREWCVEQDHCCRGWSAVLEKGPDEQKVRRARD